MDVPTDLQYTKEHEWVRSEEGVATVGITDYAQDQLGDIVYLDLPSPGATLSRFERMGEIESVKAVSDLFSPITGEVVEVNQEVVDAPELVNEEPYGRGWLLKVRLGDADGPEGLLSAAAYQQLIEAEQADQA